MQNSRKNEGPNKRRKKASGLGALRMANTSSRYRRSSRFGWARNIHYRWPFAFPAAAAILLVVLGLAIIPGLVKGKSDAKAVDVPGEAVFAGQESGSLTAEASHVGSDEFMTAEDAENAGSANDDAPVNAEADASSQTVTETVNAVESVTEPETGDDFESAVNPEAATAADSAAASAAETDSEAASETVSAPVASLTPAEVMGIDGPLVTMVREYETYDNKYTTNVALGLPECPKVDDSYFNDTVFIGDSVSEKLKYYVTQQRKENPNLLGNAVFLTAPSLSARNTLKDVTKTSLHPVYRGKKMKLEDIVAEMGVKKVYIMFGLNDVGINGAKESAKNLMTLIKEIKKKSPNVLIFIQSATPRVKGEKPTNKALFKFDMRVYKYCLKLEEQGIYFVDVAHVMRDENGKLFSDYCSDLDSMALHFNNKACQVWIDFLYTHALVAQ